jgi:hypothetical protein
VGSTHGSSHSGLERKEEAMTRVADFLTLKFVAPKKCQDKGMEKMQLRGINTTYYVGVYPSVLMAILLGHL